MKKKPKYNFEFSEKKISKLIKEWKKTSIKFAQFSVFNKNNLINKTGEIFLREYKFFYSYKNNKSKPLLN